MPDHRGGFGISAAHTPGPWKCNPPDDQVVDLFTPEYFFIEGPGADVHGHMTLADARLIAAAPDLLEALETVRRNMRKGVVGEQARRGWAKADVAIAKAKGRSCD